jgi:hypothetical protein
MPTDFRASQIQTNKIIASGSTGTTSNALLLIYPISKQSGSNQGFIDTGAFGLRDIGTDVFMFVSGAVNGKGVAGNTISVFGGDVHFSGNILLSTGSYPNVRRISLEAVPNANGLIVPENTWLYIQASNIGASGSGGYLILSGGIGGYTSASDTTHEGGWVFAVAGDAGGCDGDGVVPLSEGGWFVAQGGKGSAASATQTRTAGPGGGILLQGATGGATSLAAASGSGAGGLGGSIFSYGGTGGAATVAGSTSFAGNGGSQTIEGGRGGHTNSGDGGDGGDVSIKAGNGGNAQGPGLAGNGGSVIIQAGFPGTTASNYLQAPGYVKLLGGRVRAVDLNISGSYLQLGGPPAANHTGFGRIFLNQDGARESTGFPGYDIFFYVSGTITTGSSDRLSVFGGSVVVSGALRVGSSSTNYISESAGNMIFRDTTISGATLAKMNRTFLPAGSYINTSQLIGNPQVAGQTVVSQSEVGSTEIVLRNVLSTTNATATATVKLYNVTSGTYVEIGGPGVTTLDTTSTTPVQRQSVNLIGAVNFGTGSNIYEVQVYISNATYQAVLGSSMFVCV